MNKITTRILTVLICAVLLTVIGVVIAIAATNGGSTGAQDANTAIREAFASHKKGSTVEIEDDGTIGIPVSIDFYVDASVNPSVKTGTEGTPVIMYVINTNTVRTGTDSDVTIIRSMLDRGYVVAVYDFHNSVLATSLALENSLNVLRKNILNGAYVYSLGSPFPTSGSYHHHYIVPAGYNVQLGDVFWEMDKHGADGTLEKLVHVWNTDLRSSKAERLVKWVHDDGTRKKTEKGINDGSDPVWYNSAGTVDANGQYTKLKYAVAETITDLVNPDGTPINLDQHMNFIYPTNPTNPVPMIVAAGSAGHIAENSQKEGRPHQQVFTFNGYALAVYDHLNVPMTREDSWGYFDGKLSVGGITQDPISYSVDIYNDKKTNTAAIRYIRYTAMLEEGDPDYRFNLNIDLDAIGIMGVSKSGTMTFLGEEILQSPLVDKSKYSTLDAYEEAISDAINAFPSMKVFAEHHSESYYDNGKTQSYSKDGYTIDGGERQPWLTYDGEEILSGVQLVYCSCGNNQEDIHEGHAPVVVSRCLLDGGDGHATHYYDNTCRELGIPCITLEYDLGHTMMYGNDSNYDTDGIIAFLNFADYYLKGSAIKVVYISPLNKEADVDPTAKITIQFSGTATVDKLALVTVKDSKGNPVAGTWESDYGGTQWHFTPAKPLAGHTAYTVKVPASFSGDNGVEMGADASVTFVTDYAAANEATVNGDYITAVVPNLTEDTNAFVLRFFVSDEKAANIAKVYAVSSTTDTAGTLLGSVNLRGAGYYEVDVTPYVAEHQGETVYFRIDEGKSPVTDTIVYSNTFDGYGNYGSCAGTAYAKFDGTKKDVLAVYTYARTYVSSSTQTVENGYNSFNTTNTAIWYEEVSQAFVNDKLFKSTKLSDEDYGRRFTVSIDVYDEISRKIRFELNSCSNFNLDVVDYDAYCSNYYTKAGEWTTFTFEYQVYESKYGAAGNIQKALTVLIGTDGDNESRVQFDNLKVTETVTGVTVGNAAVVAVNNGGVDYKSPTNTASPFTVGTTGYATLKAALEAAAASNGLVTLNSNYNMTAADAYSAYVNNSSVDFVIDLNGYYINTADAAGSLITVVNSAGAANAVDITLKNGAVYLKNYALIQYTASASAGDGNVFNINVENVNLSLIKYSDLDKIILQSTINSGRSADVNVNLTETNITALNGENGNHRTTVFAKSAQTTTSIVYTVKGGAIKISDNRRILMTNADIKDLIFVKNASNERCELIVQNSKVAPSTSFWSDDTYKSFTVKTVGETHTVYTLEDGELKTDYGMIPEEYANVDYYPWVVFDENGVVTYAGTEFCLDNLPSVLKTGQNNTKTWNVVLRRDFHYNSATGYNNLSFINGTINIDLNGFTFYNDANRAMFNAQGKSATTTTINVFNGDITVTTAHPIIHSAVITVTSFTSGTKTFKFNFDGIDFKFTNGGSNLIANHASAASGVRVNTDITLNDCNIDASALSNKTVFSMGVSGGMNGVTSVTVNGGSLKVANSSITLYKANNTLSTITFSKSTSGAFFKVIQPASLAAPSFQTPSDEYVLAFDGGVADGTNTVYTLKPGGELTEYGPIPETYIDENAYPFAVFYNGELLGAAQTFSAPTNGTGTALGYALAKSKQLASDDAVFTILVRSDYTGSDALLDNMAQMYGTFVIDLNGHTMTSTSYLFNAQAKSNNVTANIVVKNGGLSVKSQALIKATAYGASYPGNKTYNFTFEDVTFGFASGATASSLLVGYVDDASTSAKTNLNISLEGCTVNMTNAPSGVTLFDANDPTGEFVTKIETENCKVLARTAGGFTYGAVHSTNGSYIDYSEGGSALKLLIPNTAAAPTGTVANGSATLTFVETGSESTNTVYSLINLVTPYGTITPGYASVTDHPFIIFYNGEIVGSATEFSYMSSGGDSALGVALAKLVAVNNANAKVTVLVRTDYISNESVVDNWTNIVGTLEIDLGNNTIGMKSYLLNAQAKNGKADVSNIVLKNGRINVNQTGILKAQTFGSAYTGKKVYNYTFEDITFGFVPGATTKSLLVSYLSDTTTTKTAALNIVLNNCTFDMTNAPASVTLINANDTASGRVITKVSVIGGKIISEVADSFALSAVHSTNGSKIEYARGIDGNYIKLLVENENTQPLSTTVIVTPEGTGSFLKLGTEDGMTLYKVAFSKKTDYGYIPAAYESAQDYPFVAFKSDGTFLGASTNLFGSSVAGTAFHAAKNAATDDNGTVIVLLRRDYTVGNEFYDNLAQFRGTLIMDLGGFTLTTSSNEPLFRVTAKASSGNMFKTTVIIKNGTINLGKNSVMGIKAYKGSYTGTGVKDFDFIYQNVTIGLAPGATTAALLTTQLYQQDMPNKVNITLDGCTIDLVTVAPSGNITVIDANDSNGWNVVTATFKGTKILVSDLSKVKFENVHASNGSSVAWGVGESLVEIHLPEGAAQPTLTLKNAEGKTVKAELVKTEGGKDIYKLAAPELRFASAFLRLNEDIDFLYAVSVPEGYENPYVVFTLNGKNYTVTDYKVEDGYYVFALCAVTPKHMGDNICATVYATYNGAPVSKTKAEYSIKQYCADLIELYPTDTALITLVSDLLTYGAASQKYSGYKTDALVTDGLDLTPSTFAPLTEDANILDMTGEADANVSWVSAGMTLGSSVTARFTFVATETDGLTVKVSINGREKEFAATDFKSLGDNIYEISFAGIMASEYDDAITVTFNRGGSQVGEMLTYSVNTYIYNMQDRTEVRFTDLVKAMYLYGKSAKAYSAND